MSYSKEYTEFEAKILNQVFAGMGIPKELVPFTPQEHAKEFDEMTAKGFRLNLLTGQYNKEDKE